MKLWGKGRSLDEKVEQFTIGKDREVDLKIAWFDVLGTMAHVQMLASIGLFTSAELGSLMKELKNILLSIEKGTYRIEEGVEDIHSQVEKDLSERLGETGEKIHAGRSRNDQVLLDIRLFMRQEIMYIVNRVKSLFDVLIKQSEQHKSSYMPGYSHLQVAMPSSFGLWFGAYAESLTDDLTLLQSAYHLVNRNPLGSAAGYGTSIPVNRKMTSQLLGFDELNFNSMYAQMSRIKVEKAVSNALASIAATLARFSTDACLFISQHFDFIRLPDEFTTGSSIMPHKKNPDLFETIRASCNKIQGLPNEITLISGNLPSGYFRDYQLLKERSIGIFEELSSNLEMTLRAVENMIINPNILEDEKYRYLFSVEEVNKRVMTGESFRDAYRKVADLIESGDFKPHKEINHIHEGSIGNLCNKEIQERMERLITGFNFPAASAAIERLLSSQ